MIVADARSRLTPEDLDLVVRCLAELAGSRRDAEQRLSTEGLDDGLDDPALGPHLLRAALPGPSPSLLFYVLVRRALVLQEVTEREVADYVAALLREFAERGRAYKASTHDDATHHYLVDIVADLSSAHGERAFKVAAHLGNYSLWFAGLYPDRVEALRLRRGGPDLSYYDELGSRGFAEASDHRLASRTGMGPLFRTAAERYPEIRRAVNQVSSQLAMRGRPLAA
ncbi:MAG TPA: hypothetical protein VMK53_06125 [Gemmatimonadales bacterium]|nr:hypothetical protein [Gemmatimonadales bacterium]